MKHDVDLLALIGHDTNLKKTANIQGRGPEYGGPCPFCGGEDRFKVQPQMGLWWCRQCSPNEHWSDAPAYVMRRDGVPYPEALRRLGLKEEAPRETAWDYHDEHGAVVYRVVRYVKGGEKQYAAQHLEGDKWVPGLNGQAPTIYRLPEVLRAARAGETVYITEGEKCADALRRLGLVATTNSGGAGKWRAAYSEHLRGADDVVIFADNDEPGEKHARQVWESVRAIVPAARIVRFPELPPAGDVADWLAKGKTKLELLDRCLPPEILDGSDVPETVKPAELIRTPGAPIDFHDLMARPRQDPRWYVPGFLREGFGVIAGEANIGKTPLGIQAGIAIASGGLFLNKVRCRQAKVLYMATEYTTDEIAYVVAKSAAGFAPPRGMMTFKSLSLDGNGGDDDIQPKTPAEAIALLEHYITALQYEVIFIDLLTGFLPDEPFKQNVYRGDYKEFRPYHLLALRYHVGIYGMWHTVKRESNPRYMYNGSSGLWGVPASRVTMYTDQENRVRLFSMPRFEAKVDWALAQATTLAGMRWVVADATPEPAMSAQEQTIYRWLRANADKGNPKTPATIAEMTALPANVVRTVLGRMNDKNIVQRGVGSGYYVDVADVAAVAGVAPVADVADVALPGEAENQAQHDVALMLREKSLPDAENGGATNATRFSAQHGATDADTPSEDAPAPTETDFWSPVPPQRLTFLRLYLRSNKETDQQRANDLCEEYGLDYEAARLIAQEESRR